MASGLASVDDQSDRAVTRIDDHDLIISREKAELAQLRHAIQHKDREVMQLCVTRNLGSEG